MKLHISVIFLFTMLSLEGFIGFFLYQQKQLELDGLQRSQVSPDHILIKLQEFFSIPCDQIVSMLDKQWEALLYDSYYANEFASNTVRLPTVPPKSVVVRNGVYQGEELIAFLPAYDATIFRAATVRRKEKTFKSDAQDTWGSRVGKLAFSSNSLKSLLPITVQTKSDDEWDHSLGSWKHMYNKELGTFKWFLKATDKNYVFVNILLQKLDKYDYNQPWYLGYHQAGSNYCSSKAGYILSQGALRLVGPHLDKCFASQADEDVMMGQCLRDLGIQPTVLHGMYPTSLIHQLLEGEGEVDKLPVSFYDVPAKQMFEFDYFFYRGNK